MANYKRWTEKEEQYLFSVIQAHQGNLKQAFELASKKLKRNPKAVCNHWYGCMKHDEKYAFCFITMGSKTMINNGKNSNSSNTTTIKISLFRRIINLFKIK